MSCCGSKRSAYIQELSSNNQMYDENRLLQEINEKQISFQYLGQGARNYRGLYTGQNYVVASYGDQIIVPELDAASFMAEPNLKVVVAQLH
jgi:hypothetical protein